MPELTNSSRILILCTGNACRSQMAEGFFRDQLNKLSLHVAADNVRSAGIETHGVNPLAVMVMNEIGIDISGYKSNNVSEYKNERFDYVVTVCDNAAERCPSFPAKTTLIHWSFDDPAKAVGDKSIVLTEFRRVRDEIGKNIKDWMQTTVI